MWLNLEKDNTLAKLRKRDSLVRSLRQFFLATHNIGRNTPYQFVRWLLEYKHQAKFSNLISSAVDRFFLRY